MVSTRVFGFFWGGWDWDFNSGLAKQALVKQVLYHLNHTSSSFCSSYSGDGISLGWSQNSILPIFQVARITGMAPSFYFLLWFWDQTQGLAHAG
jgi:hypothetical protein